MAAIGPRIRAHKEATLERVRWQADLGCTFDAAAVDDAFAHFRRLYHIRPERVLCAPDVLQRCAELFARSGDDALACDLRYDGIPLVSAVLAPGTIVFEGDVDEERMGDW